MHLVFVHDMIHRVDIHGNSILPIMVVMMMKMMVIIISFIVVCRRRGNVDEGKYLTIDVLENGETYLILCCVVVVKGSLQDLVFCLLTLFPFHFSISLVVDGKDCGRRRGDQSIGDNR